MPKKIVLYIVFILTLFLSCTSLFEVDLNTNQELIFIECDLNNFDKNQFVEIKANIASKTGIMYTIYKDAKVQIIENKTNIIDCKFDGISKYLLPDSFKVKLTASYKLKIELKNGSTLESSEESANKSNEILAINAVAKPKGVIINKREIDGHYIYLDTKDNSQTKDYYLWRWKLYERQFYCRSCDGGRYFTTPQPSGSCVNDVNLQRRGVIYEYNCLSNCWETFYNEDVNIVSDVFTPGQIIKNRLIAKIPYYQSAGGLIEVSQYAINKTAHDYFMLILSQSQNNGSLADTPPAPLIGNIKNIQNPDQPVGGIFMVSSKQIKSFWIKRDEFLLTSKPYGLLAGRIANPEPSGNDFTRPPQAPCIESKERTGIKPANWQGN